MKHINFALSSLIAIAAISLLWASADGVDTIPVNMIFYLHQKQTVKSIDSLVALLSADSSLNFAKTANIPASNNNNGGDYGNLNISGYKSFGVSIGELGEVNLEQGLEAVIEGEIRPGTVLRAQLSDNGSSLDGSTREISDFDMMFINLTNKNFSVTAGDIFAKWQDDAILSGQKKIVGISATVTPTAVAGKLSINAFGAFSGGNHTVQNIRGREGSQGPYYLTGNTGIVTPVSGTVSVRLNGKELFEGYGADFVVDYDVGAVTFNPSVLISFDDFIRIEYEYKTFDYRRTFVGGGASYHTKDSVLSVRGTLWSESDDKNQPIEMELTNSEKEILINSGDNPAYAAIAARPVHPLDVAKISVYYPLYKKIYDYEAQDTILVYTPYDPLRPNDTKDFYTASFTATHTGMAGADYTIDVSASRGQLVYKYAGAGKGDYTVLAPIAAPKRETAGEIEAQLRLPFVNASLNVAGKESDRNLFSTLDKNNNPSSAIVFKLNAGERRFDKRSIWANIDYRYRSQKFGDEIFSASELKNGWDAIDIAEALSERTLHAWESTIGVAANKFAAVSVSAGQTFVDSLAETEKITADAQLRFAQEFGADFGTAIFKHHTSNADISSRRYGKFFAHPRKSLETSLEYRDEWRKNSDGFGGGHLSGTAELAYSPINLRQSINAVQYRSGSNFFSATDTGYALTWDHSLEFKPLSMWHITGSGKWRRSQISNQSAASTFLTSVVSEIEPTSAGFSSRQEYRVNQELASRFEQKMFYIGKGLGTHAYDSTMGEFRPSVNGDHIIQEVEVYDNTSSSTVRKTTLSGDWYFRSAKKIEGILGDLSWSGMLSIEEHIDSRNGLTVSYIPGFLSLFPQKDKNAPINESSSLSPLYSDISYRQDIDYRVQGSIYKSKIYFLKTLRIVRGYEEPTFETALLVERKKNRLLLSVEPKYLSVERKDISTAQSGFGFSDVSAELIQSVSFEKAFEVYIRQRGGMILNAYQNSAAAAADNGAYVAIRPGIIHKPARGGTVELAYTLSYVPYANVLDYRMGGGYAQGICHTVTFISDVNAGKHFNISGFYRGELARKLDERSYAPMTHVLSLQVKAFL